ncbi:hypothetical protein [Capnocytophaga catalasegens]|uniref:Roadblock/LAMTOR2 domain-containing protein n=1 Tax=Capnocytophaga catalasegens TaxID=1004260 RepID=A0AAV5AVJ3_9FLAO|nr:hypothetical protein [Capnocytophaga catalasegens]GIZ14711.1 hypothetical protein RCZ03_07110 [Capnocytophaga catalasegens]GJM50559.1 hypothetical protein RCZ15_15320 [Capnocytophaga catalasegens]GJM53610.1 hypothetical protein RCZ16_19260 [Capnocytophaga catalasegens]
MDSNLFNNYVKAMHQEVPGFISITVVSTNDGNAIAYEAASNVDNRLSSAFQVEILRQATKALGYVENLNDKNIDRIEIALKEQIHVLFSSSNRQFLVHLILDEANYNIAITKMLHAKLFKAVEESYAAAPATGASVEEGQQPAVRRRLFF